MNLMISEAATVRPDSICYAVGASALGRLLIARSGAGICAILIGDDDDALAADLAHRFPKAMLSTDEALLGGDLAKVVRFVDSPAEGLELPLDPRGTPFQHRVWEKLRTVAGACAANPIALAIPCHRVVRSDGNLAGYRWGIERKRAMISMEATA